MADQKQLERLLASSKEQNKCQVWNQWRREDWDRGGVNIYSGPEISWVHYTALDVANC